MQLQGKEWRRFWGKKAAPKVPEWPSYGTFPRSPKTPIFWKKAKGDQGKFFKSRPKSSPQQIKLSSIYNALKVQRLEKILAQKADPKVPDLAKLWQFSQRHPKPAFSEKVQRGDQGKFFKNRQKRGPRLKGPKALWRKWHYPLFSVHL